VNLEKALERLVSMADRWEETPVWHSYGPDSLPFYCGEIHVTTGDLHAMSVIKKFLQGKGILNPPEVIVEFHDRNYNTRYRGMSKVHFQEMMDQDRDDRTKHFFDHSRPVAVTSEDEADFWFDFSGCADDECWEDCEKAYRESMYHPSYQANK